MPATIQDIAKAAGVSVGTVSRAMNNYADISEKTRQRILQIAQELGYRPNLMAKNLSSKHCRNIALILSGFLEDELHNDFETMLMRGIFQFTVENDLEISMHVINSEIQKEKSYEQLCYEHNIAGAVLFGLKATDPYYEDLSGSKKPCVTIDLEIAGPCVSNVTIDHIAAFESLTQYLIDQGHRKIVVVHGRKTALVSMERLAGAYQAMELSGMTLTHDAVIYTNFLKDEAYEGVLQYFRTHPHDSATAFLCMSDMLALGAMQAIKELGYRIPQDYSVVGYDGLDVANYTDPRLTTVDQNIKRKGYEAASLLYDMLLGTRKAQRLVLPHTLVVRDSVRCLTE